MSKNGAGIERVNSNVDVEAFAIVRHRAYAGCSLGSVGDTLNFSFERSDICKRGSTEYALSATRNGGCASLELPSGVGICVGWVIAAERIAEKARLPCSSPSEAPTNETWKYLSPPAGIISDVGVTANEPSSNGAVGATPRPNERAFDSPPVAMLALRGDDPDREPGAPTN